jgi:ketosteroid isomerase-like protein
MKPSLLVLAVTICAAITAAAQTQDANYAVEQEIRKLEQGQVDLLLRGDVAEMEKQWAEDFTVNNPFHKVVKGRQGPVRTGQLTYSSFVRDVETVLLKGGLAIVMGAETVVPSGKSPDAGKTIRRRFTDVWMKTGGKWLLTARHASVICPNQ